VTASCVNVCQDRKTVQTKLCCGRWLQFGVMESLETPNSLLWLDTRTTPHRGLACKHNNREPFGTPTHCHLQWVSQWPLGPQNPTQRNSAPRVNIMMNMHTPYQRQHCCTEASRATQQVAQGQHECMACMALVYSSTSSSRIYPKLCRTTGVTPV
jgi:hypothetical protein